MRAAAVRSATFVVAARSFLAVETVPVGEACGVEFATGLVRDLCRDPGSGRVAGTTDRLPVMGGFEQCVAGTGRTGVARSRRAVVVEELAQPCGDIAERSIEEVHAGSQTPPTDIGPDHGYGM
jgi:hypothetical protein